MTHPTVNELIRAINQRQAEIFRKSCALDAERHRNNYRIAVLAVRGFDPGPEEFRKPSGKEPSGA